MQHVQEQVLARSLLISGAGKASNLIDKFISWLLAGAGAALALMIGALPDIQRYIPVTKIKSAAVIFLVAAVITAVEKYLASLVVGAAETSALAAETGRQLATQGVPVDFEMVFKEMESAMFPPMRWFVRRSLNKVRRGDFVASGRNFARCAQIQGFLSVAIVGLIVWALGMIVCALGG